MNPLSTFSQLISENIYIYGKVQPDSSVRHDFHTLFFWYFSMILVSVWGPKMIYHSMKLTMCCSKLKKIEVLVLVSVNLETMIPEIQNLRDLYHIFIRFGLLSSHS